MSDAKLRELERRWLLSGAPDDEQALVAERLRHGALGPEQLELAGHCGSTIAHALGAPGPTAPLGSKAWSVALFKTWGLEAMTWLDLGGLRAHFPIWRAARPDDADLDRLFAAIEAQLLEPSPAHLETLAARLDAGLTDLAEQAAVAHCGQHTWTWLCCPHRHHHALQSARALAASVLGRMPNQEMIFERLGSLVLMGPTLPGHEADRPPLVAAAAAEVIAWSLGHTHARHRAALEAAEAASAARRAPMRLVDPRRLTAREELERFVAANPGDLAAVRRLVEASEQTGWKHEGRTLAEYRQALIAGGGVPEQDLILARLVMRIGERAVPLALDRLPSRPAFYVLAELGPRAYAAVETLVEWLGSANGSNRGEAARTLVAIGRSDAALRQAIAARVRARLDGLSHPEGALLVLLSFDVPGESVAAPLRRVFADGRWIWDLLFELRHPEALWPAARELGDRVVAKDSTPTVRGECLNVLFALGRRALPALPALERHCRDTDPPATATVRRLIETLRSS